MRRMHLEVPGLCEDVLKRGADLRIRVTGKSMSPFLRGGEYLTVRQVPCASLVKGDLVLFNSRGSLILHRIIGKCGPDNETAVFLTRGDSAGSADEPVRHDSILGKVLKIERAVATGHVRHLDMESRHWRLFNRVIAAAIPARMLMRRLLSVFPAYSPSARTEKNTGQ